MLGRFTWPFNVRCGGRALVGSAGKVGWFQFGDLWPLSMGRQSWNPR